MNFLSLFVLIPLLMMVGLALSKEMKQIRLVAVTGSAIQLLLAIGLVALYLCERACRKYSGDAVSCRYRLVCASEYPLYGGCRWCFGGDDFAFCNYCFCRGLCFLENRSSTKRIFPLAYTVIDRSIRVLHFY